MHAHLRVSKPLAGVHVRSLEGEHGTVKRPFGGYPKTHARYQGLGGDATMVVILRFIDGQVGHAKWTDTISTT